MSGGDIPVADALTPAWPERAAWGTAPSLRAWQSAALRDYLERSPRDFLAVATPGAGKTTFALSVAAELIGRRVVERIIVVAPTEHLKLQWAEAAARAGIPIDPSYSAGKGRIASDFVGVAVTYAGVGVNPLALRIRTERFKTLVILDEIHHAGDAMSWGEGVLEAFQPATRRLALTGTPFRSDVNPIPFVTYAPGLDGVPRSVADYTYGYEHALADHVVRPVLFLAYSGEMSWRTRAGDEIAARLGEPMTKDLTNQALRTALDPAGSWVPSVLAAADKRLSEVRRHVPDAGGLVIATDQDSARAYAKTLRSITGEAPTVVLSDEKAASKKITAFTDDGSRWMVAVRMVSEGVDVPRLAVGVWATTTATPLFFAQAVGRFVRARTRGETASVFLPSVPGLLGFASEMELERDHVLGRRITDEDDIFAAEDDLLRQAETAQASPTTRVCPSRPSGRRPASTTRSTRARRSATRATWRSARRRRWTSSASPDCSSPDRCASCCSSARATGARPAAPVPGPTPTWRRRCARSPPTSSSPPCVASSTASSAPGTTAPARRTASPTPRCARSAAAPPPPSPTPSSCGPGSTGSVTGRRVAAPEPRRPDRSGRRAGSPSSPGSLSAGGSDRPDGDRGGGGVGPAGSVMRAPGTPHG